MVVVVSHDHYRVAEGHAPTPCEHTPACSLPFHCCRPQGLPTDISAATGGRVAALLRYAPIAGGWRVIFGLLFPDCAAPHYLPHPAPYQMDGDHDLFYLVDRDGPLTAVFPPRRSHYRCGETHWYLIH